MDGWPDKAEPYRTAGGKAAEKTWRFRVSSSNRRTQTEVARCDGIVGREMASRRGDRPHSRRSAVDGSILLAFQAGTRQAMMQTPPRSVERPA